jgi:hypothetical protein
MTRLTVRALTVILLLASCALAARADASFTAATLQGVVRKVAANGVWVAAEGGMVRVPPAASTFRVDGRVVPPASLAEGAKVTVEMPAVHGSVLGAVGDQVTVMSQFGYPITLSARHLDPASADRPVCVQDFDGTVHRVTMRRAIELAENGEADILGDVPVGTVVDGQVVGEAFGK